MTSPSGHAGKKSNRGLFPLLLHFVLVCGVQAAYARAYVHSPSLRSAVIIPTLFRLATWTLPVFLVLFLSRTDPLDYLKLRQGARRGFTWGVIIGMIIVGLNWMGAGLLKHRSNLNFDLGLNLWIGPVLLVGLSEEVLFRGFFLQKFAERTSFSRANLLQAFLFVLIHVPGWAFLGQLKSPAILQPIGYVFGIGLVLGYVLKKSNSLWACMVAHSFSNFASFAMAAA